MIRGVADRPGSVSLCFRKDDKFNLKETRVTRATQQRRPSKEIPFSKRDRLSLPYKCGNTLCNPS